MRNRSAAIETTTERDRLGNPFNDFLASYVDTPQGRVTGRLSVDDIVSIRETTLSEAPNRTYVSVLGYVESVRTFMSVKWPARHPFGVFRLDSGTGAAAIVTLTSVKYEKYWGDLVMGRRVRVCGAVTRSEQGAPVTLRLDRLTVLRTLLVTPAQDTHRLAGAR
jgi:DNA polymerase III alpha subunit